MKINPGLIGQVVYLSFLIYNDSTCFVGLLWGLNDLMHGKSAVLSFPLCLGDLILTAFPGGNGPGSVLPVRRLKLGERLSYPSYNQGQNHDQNPGLGIPSILPFPLFHTIPWAPVMGNIGPNQVRLTPLVGLPCVQGQTRARWQMVIQDPSVAME